MLTLRKWNSNDQTLMETWEYKGLETHPRHSENNSRVQSSKVLGIPWNAIHDYFTIDVKELLELDISKPVTKRIVLQSAAIGIDLMFRRQAVLPSAPTNFTFSHGGVNAREKGVRTIDVEIRFEWGRDRCERK
ncbi:hypothetical protein NPIL_655721 [Nephila pilipes]|uniref:Uncharacterized protein n=1 Tax=Nephila pilipes TaxID=299642 RepID=A0A8X6JGT9_NEPPI|nr:hypothetical protein NPIL_655721 [Nephila pilipes]